MARKKKEVNDKSSLKTSSLQNQSLEGIENDSQIGEDPSKSTTSSTLDTNLDISPNGWNETYETVNEKIKKSLPSSTNEIILNSVSFNQSLDLDFESNQWNNMREYDELLQLQNQVSHSSLKRHSTSFESEDENHFDMEQSVPLSFSPKKLKIPK